MKQLSNSELIVNSNGSVYHLGLLPEHISDTVITVGDPERVKSITQHFDVIDFEIQNREFKTAGGRIGNKPITVMSTGIGTDNIDIVFNELAFLLNFNLQTLEQNEVTKSIDIIRLGTSGSISKKNSIDSIVYSKRAISFEDLFQFYNHSFDTLTFDEREYPVIDCSSQLERRFNSYNPSLTLTAKGFYGPQFRNAQLSPKYDLKDICEIDYKGEKVGNMEMETAGIYGLSKLLGFEAISLNAILADRLNGRFSANPQAVIDRMIKETLDLLCNSNS
ncbi:MAG: phosphorylase [Bacteroidetes bacterium]|nr:MAG: phosphorylase [Bacteroidota bacterium]